VTSQERVSEARVKVARHVQDALASLHAAGFDVQTETGRTKHFRAIGSAMSALELAAKELAR
jgi:hypothetical protein